jgi:hypothetical protein
MEKPTIVADGLLSRLPSSDTVDVAAIDPHVSQLLVAHTGEYLRVVPVPVPPLNEADDR